MYIKKYWGNFIGGSDDSLNLVAVSYTHLKTFANTETDRRSNGKSCPGYLTRARPSKFG